MIMEKVNLAWAVIWGVLFVFCVVGIFWNPAHFVTAAISALFFGMFMHDYIKDKRNK